MQCQSVDILILESELAGANWILCSTQTDYVVSGPQWFYFQNCICYKSKKKTCLFSPEKWKV